MSFTPKQRKEIMERDQHRCRAFWIAPDLACSNNLEIDHIIPRGRGGKDDTSNGWCLCSIHHKIKHEHPEAATYLGLYGRETFTKKYDQIDPETFGQYILYIRRQHLKMLGVYSDNSF